MKQYKIYFALFDHIESRSNEVRLTHEGLSAHPRVTLVDTPEAADFLVFCQNHLVEHCPYHARFRPMKDRFKERSILLDYDDNPHHIYDADDFRWRLYFKRSCVDRRSGCEMKYPGLRVRPTAYCLMDDMADPPTDWDGNRDLDIACLFDASVEQTPWYSSGRGELRKFARRFSVNHRVNMKLGTVSECGPIGRSAVDPEYKRTLYRSKIILHANPDPWEGDSRTWESVGSGALVFVDRMLAPIRHPLVDGEHVIFYDFANGGMETLERRILYYLENDRERTNIAQWGRSFVLQNHRSINRANEIVDELDRDTGAKRRAVTYDSRFKRLSRNKRFVIINNYKCGYSSSNMLETEPVQEITADDRLILFYRNIFHRAVSVFINWCVTNDRYRHAEGWLFNNIREALTARAFEGFVDNFHTDRLEDAFTTYVRVLESIYRKNPHTLPQTDILRTFEISRIDYFINLECAGNLERLTDVPFPFDAGNASDRMFKARCLDLLDTDHRLRATIRVVYEDDITFFRKNGIPIDRD